MALTQSDLPIGWAFFTDGDGRRVARRIHDDDHPLTVMGGGVMGYQSAPVQPTARYLGAAGGVVSNQKPLGMPSTAPNQPAPSPPPTANARLGAVPLGLPDWGSVWGAQDVASNAPTANSGQLASPPPPTRMAGKQRPLTLPQMTF
jgi:hypothetical protein